VSFVVEQLKAVFDPRGGQWMGGQYVPSLLAAIGEVLEEHMVSIGFLEAQRQERRGLCPRRGPRAGQLPALWSAQPDPPGGLQPPHILRLLQVRVIG